MLVWCWPRREVVCCWFDEPMERHSTKATVTSPSDVTSHAGQRHSSFQTSLNLKRAKGQPMASLRVQPQPTVRLQVSLPSLRILHISSHHFSASSDSCHILVNNKGQERNNLKPCPYLGIAPLLEMKARICTIQSNS